MVKVHRAKEEVTQEAKAYSPINDGEVIFRLSSEDRTALKQARDIMRESKPSKEYRDLQSEAVKELISKRDELHDIFLTNPDSISTIPVVLKVNPEFKEELTEEAKKVSLSLSDYIRAIIYTTGTQLAQEHEQKQNAVNERIKANKVKPVFVRVDKEARTKLSAKYGAMNSSKLSEVVNTEFGQWLKEMK